ncbi:hypothetical protein [Streptomyces pinistramenti]|nr:hypothetical protein [Streptomyces pinistramenti]
MWVFGNGTFTNNGDRGWSNWGMTGWFDSSNDGKTAAFQQS